MLRLDRHSLVQQLLRGLSSTDSSLPAFAQLAAWRLDADSVLISLRDADREYVLCRRGRLDSLLEPDRELVPTSTLCADGPSVFAFDRWLSSMSNDPGIPLKVLSGEDYPEAGAQSCVSAIPIVHSSGHLIGCLSVVSQKRRTLSTPDSSFLSELATTIANHLDLVRSQSSHRRDQRMIRGLEAFQARDSPVPGESSPQINAGAPAEDACAQISLGKRVFEAFINDTTDLADSENEKQKEPQSNKPIVKQLPGDLTDKSGTQHTSTAVVVGDYDMRAADTAVVEQIFEHVCRQMLNVSALDGVVFFEPNLEPGQSSQNESDARSSQPARVLGIATRAQGSAHLLPQFKSISQKNVRNLMNTFPRGRVFTASDSSSGLAVELCDFMPNAVSFAFVPFWDLQTSQGQAGCFAWTEDPHHVLDQDLDLAFISVYGRNALAEGLRIRADAADAVKSRFISSINHELRSPLHGILGALQLLQAAPLEAFEKRMLDTIESCGNTLLDTVEGILDLSGLNLASDRKKKAIMMGEGNQQMDLSDRNTDTHDMVGMIEEVMMSALLAHVTLGRASLPADEATAGSSKLLARSKMGRLLQPRLPQVVIQTDWSKDWVCSLPATALRRIILSLFTNALKFTESGHILIAARQSKATDSMDTEASPQPMSFTITDTGKGMSAEFLTRHVGKAFQQEDILTTGTGLGLHLTQKTVRELGGTIELQSTQGLGTEVEVHLPTSRYVEPSSRESLFSARQIKDIVSGLQVVLLGWDTLEDSRDQRGMQLAKQSFSELFQACFGMKVRSGAAIAADEQVDVILCDDVHFEKLRAEGTLESVRHKPVAFLVFCSSIRYAAYMSGEYAELSFLTPPPGPNQISRVLVRHFAREADKASGAGADSPDSRLEAADMAIKQASENEKRFDAAAERLQQTVQGTTKEQSPHTVPTTENQQEDKQRLLLVEDNNINMQLLVRFAKKCNMAYETACDGLQALQAYQKAASESSKFDSVIMDISMPVMDGLESMQRIRAWEAEQKLTACKIIALTGVASQEVHDKAIEAGCDVFLAKPASFETIKQALNGEA